MGSAAIQAPGPVLALPFSSSGPPTADVLPDPTPDPRPPSQPRPKRTPGEPPVRRAAPRSLMGLSPVLKRRGAQRGETTFPRQHSQRAAHPHQRVSRLPPVAPQAGGSAMGASGWTGCESSRKESFGVSVSSSVSQAWGPGLAGDTSLEGARKGSVGSGLGEKGIVGGRGSLAGKQARWEAPCPARSRAQPAAPLQAADCSAPHCPGGSRRLAAARTRPAPLAGPGGAGLGLRKRAGMPEARRGGGQGATGQGDTVERCRRGVRAARHLLGGKGGGTRHDWPPGGASTSRTGAWAGGSCLGPAGGLGGGRWGRVGGDGAAPTYSPQPPALPQDRPWGTVSLPPAPQKPAALRFQALCRRFFSFPVTTAPGP